MHHADAGRERIARTGELHLAVVDEYVPCIRPIDAGENFSERALAGAVFAAERVARAGGDAERHVVERLHAGESLGDSLEPDGGSAHDDSPATAARPARRRAVNRVLD